MGKIIYPDVSCEIIARKVLANKTPNSISNGERVAENKFYERGNK
jgi:hypothetical protein